MTASVTGAEGRSGPTKRPTDGYERRLAGGEN
jgi:hypothetical protein